MRRLTSAERCALRTFGPPGEGPVHEETFTELERLGWGRWAEDGWEVTAAGERALALDTAADA